MLEKFFKEIDENWKDLEGSKIVMQIIGCSALLLQTDYNRGTKDSDILETEEISTDVKARLLKIAGPNTQLHKKYRVYLEFTKSGFPFLPIKANYNEIKYLNDNLKHFIIKALDVVDVVVSKIKTFRPQDVDDIRAMVERDLVPPDKLVQRFQAAVNRWDLDARAEELPLYIQNLHTVQRDMLLVKETPIDLPRWLEEST